MPVMTTPDPTVSTSPNEESSADLLALTKVTKALHDRGLSPDETKAALKTDLEMNRAKRNQATKT